MRGLFSDITSSLIARSLDGKGVRHRVIADNIANVETPGFTRSDVSFDAQLKQAMEAPSKASARRRLQEIEPEVQIDTASPARPNGNNVSIDKEMAEMTRNSLEYEALLRLLNMKGEMVRTAIWEGKR